jgi:rubredoxin-NAD+ reductase
MSAHPASPSGTPGTPVASLSNAPAPNAAAPLVVVGAGLAGWTTVREFRKLDSVTPVIVVTTDSGDFYAKPSLSNALAQKRTPAQLISTPAAKMAETLNVKLMAFTTVSRIDTARQELTLQAAGASHTLAYQQLVLATGARPIRSAMAGNAADQVLSVNALDDFAALYARLSTPGGGPSVPGSDGASARPQSAVAADTSVRSAAATFAHKTVLVIGAGLIGCEFANDLLQAGHRVHVVDPSPRPLAALLPQAAGLQLLTALQDLGVEWHLGTTVQAVASAEQTPGAAIGTRLCVTLADGTQVQVDAVLSAIGLRADTTLASAAGLACERGILVDAHLQTTAAQVYALGDGAQYASAGQRTLPFVMPIMSAAKALAATLSGTRTELVFPLMPVSIKTPALPIVVASAHPALAGAWIADAAEPQGVWRFMDSEGAQRGFVLTGKSTARRAELSKATQIQESENHSDPTH